MTSKNKSQTLTSHLDQKNKSIEKQSLILNNSEGFT